MFSLRRTLPARHHRRTPCVTVRAAASEKRAPRPQNVPGQFFVDHTCIDCDTCRWMCPSSFSRVEGQSAVIAQPTSAAERQQAAKALLSCPTYSIHATSLAAEDLKAAQQGLPAPVAHCPGVYHCGWHSVKSYAGTSYLITRPQGNILVDSPRFNPVLARRIQELGGVKYMFLSHKDDVADHAAWAKHTGCLRLLHAAEVQPGTAEVEVKLQGEGPWALPDGGEDVELVFTPGHTSGHVCLLHRPTQALFTGDHLCSSRGEEAEKAEAEGQQPSLYVFKDFNWYSFPLQLQSVAALSKLPFRHVLPGHGRRAHFATTQDCKVAIQQLLQLHGYPEAAVATA